MVKKTSLRQKVISVIERAVKNGNAFFACPGKNFVSIKSYVSQMRHLYPGKVFRVEFMEGGATIYATESPDMKRIDEILEAVTALPDMGCAIFPVGQKGYGIDGYTPTYIRSRLPVIAGSEFKVYYQKAGKRIFVFRIPLPENTDMI